MVGLGLRPGRSARRLIGSSGSSAPTALPQLGALVAHWDAGTITPQADNTNLTTWTDSVGGLTATVPATAPKYRTTGLNNLPYVQSAAGTAYMDAGRPTALANAIDSGNYTIMVVARNIGVKSNGMLFGANTSGNNGPYILGNGSRAGVYQASNTRSLPFTTGFAVIGDISYSGAYFGNSGIRRMSLNGTIFAEETNAGPVSNGNFGIFGRATGTVPCIADIYDIIVWNVALTPAEILQVKKWACDKFGLAYPWAAPNKFRIMAGDSLCAGQNATTPTGSYPYQLAQSLGLSLGQWTNLGIRGITMPQMNSVAATDVDTIPAMVGVPCVLCVDEWYNQAGAAPTPENNSRAYLAARKAANPMIKIAFGTSTSSASGATNRANYNAAFDVSHTTNIDGYVPLHLNANIGVQGTESNATFFGGDSIHLTDLGYTQKSNEYYALVSAL